MTRPRSGFPSVLLWLATLLVACGPAGSAAERGAAPGAVVIPREPGPDRWAAEARVRCARLEREPKLRCFEEAVLATLREHGVAPAMETVDRLAAADPDAWHHGHVLAHVVGLAAFRAPQEVGAVFTECTPAFQSGCYHGVIQAYFAAVQAAGLAQPGAAELNGLCADYRGEGGDRWLLFQCAHGMGHGLVAVHDYRLPDALLGCDLLEDGWERESCYGGAFMENVVNATMPHHVAGGGGAPGEGSPEPQDHGAHHADPQGQHPSGHHDDAQHHHGGQAEFKALDPDQPHYPCSVLDSRYLNACYAMQTSAVLYWTEGDVAAGVEFCGEAPEQVRSTCFTSLGRDINAYTRHDFRRAIERCDLAPERYRPACVIGVAKNLIDVTADAADGAAFCATVPVGASRERCFQAVGEQVAVLESEADRRAAFCATLAASDAPACRFGAGVREVTEPGR